MNRKKPQKIPPISSFLVNANNFLFINSKVSRVAMPNRKVAKEKGGASFSASLTIINVAPQIRVTKTSNSCAVIFLFNLYILKI